MKYSERFANQWDNFVDAFQSEINALPTEAVTKKNVSEWYRNNSFRWSSIAENEGILLENEKNEKLRSSLIGAIEAFTFVEAAAADKKLRFLPYMITGIAAAALAGILTKRFLHTGIAVIVIETVIILLGAAAMYAVSLDKGVKLHKDQVCGAYIRQLKNYKETLVNICRRYEKI